MKKPLCYFRFLVLFSAACLLFCSAAIADEEIPLEVRLAQTASGRGSEYVTELSENWKFGGMDADASAEDSDDRLWNTVNLPHTWNTADGADGGSDYIRTAFWYRKTINIDTSLEGKRVYLEFLGANQKTDLYVNGVHILLSGNSGYTHKGGYTAFRYDMTDALRTGSNIIAVKVDNSLDEEIAPISGDFNMYGGIYRRVYMITVSDVHFDLSDNGSSGLYLTTPNVRSLERPDDLGALNIRAAIDNQGKTRKTVTVTAHIEGDNAPADISRTISVDANSKMTFDVDMYVPDPHLWKGIDFSGKTDNSDVGYRYTVTLTLSDGEQILDTLSDKVGFRYFYVDKETGFYLNGESHPLRGVNRHQFMEGMGSAITEKEHDEDIQLILELGANSIRLCHYPHTDYFYDLCDENGIIVWTEVPLVNAVGQSADFSSVTKEQLTELIRQQYNRPCICFWGLQNEIYDKSRSSYTTPKALLADLDDLAHREDSSGRYTTQAIYQDTPMDLNDPSKLEDSKAKIGWKSDLLSWNIYTGWYAHYEGIFEDYVNNKAGMDSRPIGISEYGWGSSTIQHELYPVLGENGLASGSDWHPEEYQNLMHEDAIAIINKTDSLWGTYIWAMFDFDVDSRDEGSRAAQNDKGLVTNDRKTKKDSFYLYKANWNKLESFVYITSRRYASRDSSKTYVKVYSNCDQVKLYKDGVFIGNMTNMGNGVFLIENVDLDIGENKLRAVGFCMTDGKMCDDACVWTRIKSSSTDLVSDVLLVDTKTRTVKLDHLMTLGELRNNLFGKNNAQYTILSNGAEVTDENAMIFTGMTASVTSENGEKTNVYTFTASIPLADKKVTATSIEDGKPVQNAVDGDSSTRWVAESNEYPQSITVDLGDTFFLDTLTIDWYKDSGRYYAYTVEISEDGVEFFPVADRSDNTVSGTTNDDLRWVQGRYVRINVLSCSSRKGYASLYEIKMDCWYFGSSAYDIDDENKVILVPDTDGLTKKELASHLSARGNCGFTILAETELIEEGTEVSVTTFHGRTILYTVTTAEYAYRYPAELALFKDVYCSSEEGISAKKDARATSVNDGLTSTAWVANTTVRERANYPEWITVDLGREYSIYGVDLRFETKGNRIYSYQIYASLDYPFIDGDTLSPEAKLIIDRSANKNFENGHYSFDVIGGKKARYITVLVLGNNKYPDNQLAAAGIYDLKVYGTSYSPLQTK